MYQTTQKNNSLNPQQHNTFFIFAKNSKTQKSSKLTLKQNKQVQFIQDSSFHPIYDPRTEKHSIWYIMPNKDKTAFISNQHSSEYLKYDNQHKKLICAPLDEENCQQFTWNIFLGQKLKEYKILQLHNKFDLLDYTSQNPLQKQDFRVTLYPVKFFETQNINQKTINRLEPEQKFIQEKANLREDIIPNFSGQVFLKDSNSSVYMKHAQQYATSSYPPEQMQPGVICYPESVSDIQAALKYAKNKNYKVTTRSGGHQYSGKSSGDASTLVIDLGNTKNFTKIQQNIKNKNFIDVYPGVKLYELNNFLQNTKCSIPHGQCQYVCIGGHGQTGGYGNFLRSFGLNMDYIQSFQIVTADGKIHDLVRPESKLKYFKNKQEQDQNNQFFTGVLTGNAGSFGVITRYTYNVIRDQDHPKSWFYHNYRTLDIKIFKELLQQYGEWTVKIKNNDQKSLNGMDYILTVQSFDPKILFNKSSSMLMELLYSDPNPPQQNSSYKEIYDRLIKKFQNEDSNKFLEKFVDKVFKLSGQLFHKYKGERPLSYISSTSLKKWPGMAYGNKREFNLPYKKRANITVDSLTSQFIERFCDFLKKVSQTPIGFVIQMQCGGGQYKRKGQWLKKLKLHTIPHRELTFGFTFDFFYQQDQLKQAQSYQLQLQIIVNETFSFIGNNQRQQKRLFWATFGNTDMKDQEVIKMYYDSIQQYEALQNLKSKYDKQDLFSTNLTIKPYTGLSSKPVEPSPDPQAQIQ